MSWYKVERGWLDNGFFQDAPYSERDAWMWMIGEAAWEDSRISVKGNPFDLKKGQLYASIRFMAEKFQWSNDRVVRFLNRLTNWGMASTDTSTGQNLITISNYSKYQDRKPEASTESLTPASTDTSTAAEHRQVQTERDSRPSSIKDKEEARAEILPEPAPPAADAKPKKDKSSKGSRLPPDWKLPDEWGDWAMEFCRKKGLTDAKPFVVEQGAMFGNYWKAKAGAGATKLDWKATWENWVRRGLPDYVLKQKRLEREKQYEQLRRGR